MPAFTGRLTVIAYYLHRMTGKGYIALDNSPPKDSMFLEQMVNTGERAATVTAKEKFRMVVGRGLSPAKDGAAICFLSWCAKSCTKTVLRLKKLNCKKKSGWRFKRDLV
jgi:hypothetical protein